MGLFAAMEHVHAFAMSRRETVATWLGFDGHDIPLVSWFEAMQRAAVIEPGRLGKEAAFDALKQWFIGPDRQCEGT